MHLQSQFHHLVHLLESGLLDQGSGVKMLEMCMALFKHFWCRKNSSGPSLLGLQRAAKIAKNGYCMHINLEVLLSM